MNKNISFLVDQKLHKEFKIFCIENDIEIKRFFTQCMKLAVENKLNIEEIKNEKNSDSK